MSEVVKTVEVPLFLKRTHELAGLLKRIQKGSSDAVDLLIETMSATEELVPLKMRLECAKALVEFEVRIADQISKDQLTRQIAEIKVKGLTTPLETDTKRLPPKTDFSNIQMVE